MFDWLESLLAETEQADQRENEDNGVAVFLPLTGVRVLSVYSAPASVARPGLTERPGSIWTSNNHSESALTEESTVIPKQALTKTPAEKAGFVWAERSEQGGRNLSAASALYHLHHRGEESSAVRALYQRVTRSANGTTSMAGLYHSVTEQEEMVPPRSLTLLEFDRTVRRDSRRYDGGMSIY